MSSEELAEGIKKAALGAAFFYYKTAYFLSQGIMPRRRPPTSSI